MGKNDEKIIDFITIGGATEDITFFTDKGKIINLRGEGDFIGFKYGTKIKIDNTRSDFGGGAANVSVNLANIGFSVSVKISIGDDPRGELILKNLIKMGVNTSLVEIEKGCDSGFSFLITGPDNEHILFASVAANGRLKIKNSDLTSLNSTKWIFVSSLSGEWKQSLDKIFLKSNSKIAWNPGDKQLQSLASIKKYIKKTEVLILNKEEAKILISSDSTINKKSPSNLNDIKSLVNVIKGYGPRIAVVTDGKNGAIAYDGVKFFKAAGAKIKKVVDTTGCGDCFGSTFVAGLELTNYDIDKSMKIAIKNVSSVLMSVGAQRGLLKRKELFG